VNVRHMLVALGVAGALAGCKKSSGAAGHTVGGVGRAVSEGLASDLRLSPDGDWAAYLKNATKPKMDGVPPQMVIGTLHVTPTAGGATRKLGDGVTNVPGGWAFSPDSKWLLYVTNYNPVGQSGVLWAVPLGTEGEPTKLGASVSYLLVSPDSKQLAFVDDGVLKLGALPGGPFREVSGEVANVHFSPDSQKLAYKRRLSAAGGFFLLDTANSASTPKKLGEQAGDFSFSPDGKQLAFNTRSEAVRNTYDLQLTDVATGKTVKLVEGVGVFAFSPDSKWLARTEGRRPELLGTLFVGPASGGPGRKLGERVSEMEFSPDSAALAYLERYDEAARAGIVSVATFPDGPPKQIAGRVPNFMWGADGKWLAFLERFIKPIYSVDLMLYEVGQKDPTKLMAGVFGYGFTPKNARILFRSNCIREGRACDLFQVELSKPTDPPRKIIEGVFGFRSCPQSERLVVSYAQTQADSFDVAVFNLAAGKHVTLDRNVSLPAICAKEDGSAIAYIVKDLKRPGVYVATQGVP
jgi:dipeptidyl aminopeptidase/acylaminoacyl peptidase